MTFERAIPKNDSAITFDAESRARIMLSDVEYILSTHKLQTDARHMVFLLEAAVSKTASVFQLAMKACEYFGRPDLKTSIKKNYTKGGSSFLGAVSRLREDLFHEGQGIMGSEIYYPFGKMKGNSFVGIYVYQGGSFTVYGHHIFDASACEFAITSGGIYQVTNVGAVDETWSRLSSVLSIESIDVGSIVSVLKDAVAELKRIWMDLRNIRVKGDGTLEYRYPTTGFMELLEEQDGMLKKYELFNSMHVRGNLTVTPPNSLEIRPAQLIYSIKDEKRPQK